MSRALLPVALLAVACAGAPPRDPADLACTSAPVAGVHPRAAALAAALARAHAAGLPGLAALVRSPEGTWVGAAGLADLDLLAPMQPCTRSRVGSVSKTFTALLVLRLVDQGVVDLDQPLARYVAAADLQGIANGGLATVRQALQHTSGIPHGLDDLGTGLAYLFEHPTTPRDMRAYLDGIRGRPADFPPGQGWRYSNSNYHLLGLLVEAVTGRTFAEALRVELLVPLGLAATTFGPATGLARGYLDRHGDGTLMDSTDFTLGVETPAGGVGSSVLDVARMVEAAAAEPRLAQWVEVPAASAVTPGQTGYGLGLMRWHSARGDAVGHAGFTFGWEARAWVLPERQVTVVLLTNAALGLPHRTLLETEAEVLSALLD